MFATAEESEQVEITQNQKKSKTRERGNLNWMEILVRHSEILDLFQIRRNVF